MELTPERVVSLQNGDEVQLQVKNGGPVPIDLTVLYLDGQYGIGVLYPKLGESNRLVPRANISIPFTIKDRTTGLEGVAFVAVEMRRHEDRHDLSFLEQAPLERTCAVTAGIRGSEDTAHKGFMAPGFDGRTSSRDTGGAHQHTEMKSYQWRVEGTGRQDKRGR
jgi:hypothetical protein